MSPGRAREGPFASPPAQPGTVRGPALLTVPGPGRGRRRPAAWWWEQDVWSENEGWSALLPSLLLSAGAGGCGRRARGVRVRVRVYARACGETGRAAGPGVRVGAWCRGPHASSSAPSVSLSGTTTRNSVVVSSFLFAGVCVVWACACGRRRRSSLNPHNRLGRCPTQSSHTRHQCTPTPRPPLGSGRPPSTPSAAALPGLCSVRLPPPRPRPTTPPPPALSPRRA